ncbi:MAG: ROK family protein [Clostridiales bacterium]|nr:ROK family protein [Clostridiales bacterium]
MRYFIGIDIGGINIAVGVVDEEKNMLKKLSVPTGADRKAEALIDDMVASVRAVLELAGMTLSEITSIGIGVPGAVTSDGNVIQAVNLGWKNLPLQEIMSSRLGLPVYLGNDADCAALGEVVAGSGSNCNSALMITLGTGIGGGFIVNGKIFSGCTGQGTEPGHFTFCYGGELCGCGKRGCFEAYTSATALIRQTRRAMEKNPDSKMWALVDGDIDKVNGKVPFDAAKLDDGTARAVVAQYIDYLAMGIAGIVDTFRPELIIMGGGICNQGDYLMIPLNEGIRKYSFAADEFPPPPAVRATLGNDAGIIGAAALQMSMEKK